MPGFGKVTLAELAGWGWVTTGGSHLSKAELLQQLRLEAARLWAWAAAKGKGI